MPRSLTPALEARLSDRITAPVFLIELDRLGVISRYSTRGEVVWRGETYYSGVASVTEYSNAQQGEVAQMTVRLPALDETLVAELLTSDWRELRARAWMTYAPEFADDDPVMIIDGNVNGFRGDKEDIVLYLISQTSSSTRSPRVVCAPPLMNCLPPDGTVFLWGGNTLTINRR